MTHFTSDKPVEDRSDDLLQRYPFAERIAQRISTSNAGDSIVIGIYGAWGEGKTSVIKFIQKELANDSKLVKVIFNPWRFTDETTLLESFFNTLAIAVTSQITEGDDSEKPEQGKTDQNPLRTKGEEIGEAIMKYSKLLTFHSAGQSLQAVGELLSNVDIETLRNRLERLIIQTGKKLVVFIDDIDRLEKSEIHSIFRLVKLTADFSNTFYVLAFDHEMVASAIGERFGDGDKQAGINFLEKIIQVPLTLPTAPPDALKDLCFRYVDKAITESEIEFKEDDVRRFVSIFSEHVLIRLKTPRLAVRYGNSLSFYLPFLKGEINYVDLMLVEALRIYYPEHYDFVKRNPRSFTTPYTNNPSFNLTESFEEKKKNLKESLEKLSNSFSKRESESVLGLLKSLFPRLDEVYGNINHHFSADQWYKEKRIASPQYFKRYLYMSIIKGELSDVLFENTMDKVGEISIDDLAEELKLLINQSSVDNFLHKIRSLEDDLPWEKSKDLVLAFSMIGETFPRKKSFLPFNLGSPDRQAATFIYQLLKKHNNQDESIVVAKELMVTAIPFEFAYEINNMMRMGNTPEEKIFSTEQYYDLANDLIQRAIEEAGDSPIFEWYSDYISYLYGTWNEIDKNAVIKYTENIFKEHPKKIKELVVGFTPVAISTGHPEPYKTDFPKEQYEYLTSIIDREYLHDLIIQEFGSEIAEKEATFREPRDDQTEINILRQFIYWYKKEKERNENTGE